MNRYPVGSCFPSAQKLSLGPADLLRIFLRAVGESRLTNDIALPSSSSASVCHLWERCQKIAVVVHLELAGVFMTPSFLKQLLGSRQETNPKPIGIARKSHSFKPVAQASEYRARLPNWIKRVGLVCERVCLCLFLNTRPLSALSSCLYISSTVYRQ